MTWDDLIAKVAEESTVEDGLIAVADADTGIIATLKQQLADALSGVTVGPEVQAKIDTAFNQAQANISKVTDAVTRNTPQA
jgi:hypothetical protein